MTHVKILGRLLIAAFTFFIISAGPSIGWGKKPPWAGGPGSPHDPPPVTAPEPTTLSLIVVGGIGVAGHYLAKRKRKK